MKIATLIIILILLFFVSIGCFHNKSSNSLPEDFNSVSMSIDLGTPLKQNEMTYCVQEEGQPQEWITNPLIQKLHRDVVGEGGYERIWVRRGSASSGYADNLPLQDDCVTYDFSKIKTIVQTTLNQGAIPYISFGNSPWCFIKDKVANGTNISAVNPVLPDDLSSMANYEAVVVKELYDSCTNGQLTGCGDFSSWKFEIGNETLKQVSDSTYATWFDLSYQAIKQKVPQAVVGFGCLGSADDKEGVQVSRY